MNKYSVEMYQDKEGEITLVLYMHGITTPEYAVHMEINPSVERACSIIDNPENEELWGELEGDLVKQVRRVQEAYRNEELNLVYYKECGNDYYRDIIEHSWKGEASGKAYAAIVERELFLK